MQVVDIMAKAVWNGQTLAESEKTEMVEGNIYFPEESVKREFLKVDEQEKNVRSVLAKMESGFIRRLIELQHE